MKKILMMAALAAASFSAQADCKWTLKGDSMDFAFDKREHFTKTAAGTLALDAANVALDLNMSPKQRFWTAVLPGFIHELGSACDGRRAFSHQDMVYNMLGAAVGVGVGQGARVLLTPRSVQVHMEF